MTLPKSFSRLFEFYNDREYFNLLLKIALPIALQNLVFSGLSMVSLVMIGQEGDTAVAAVGLSGQVFFLLNLVLFGLGSGTGMFTAQLWGKKDLANIRKVLGLSLRMFLGVSIIFFFISQFFPSQVLGIYSDDPQVVLVGSQYLQIFGWSFLFFGITTAYVFILRSTGEVRLPVTASLISLSVNAILTYLLVFGGLGFPSLGLKGAAIATLIARMVECTILLALIYGQNNSIAKVTWSEISYFDWGFTWKIMRPVIPVALNEIFWSLGVTTYNIIYAHMGTESIAAMNIFSAVDSLAIVFFIGLANATAILVGNRIGSHEDQKAHQYAGRSIGLAMFTGLIVGGVILVLRNPIVDLYKVTPQTSEYAYQVMTIAALAIWIRASNMVIIVGTLRSGGDTIYSLVLDGFIIWLVGVPLAAFGAFYLLLPIQFVYLLVLSEELTKFAFGLRRYFSRKWINHLFQFV